MATSFFVTGIKEMMMIMMMMSRFVERVMFLRRAVSDSKCILADVSLREPVDRELTLRLLH